jgi:7-keto-8-aminopelargonate synthetase-like enzyme
MNKKNWQKIKILEGKKFQEEAFKKTNNLIFLKRKERIVTLEDGEKYCEFISCGYLGLEQNKSVIKQIKKNISETGVTFPASRTRIQSIYSREFESLLEKIFNGSVLTFQNLHVAHLGMIPLISSGELPNFPVKESGIVFILDKTAHASLQINRGLMQQFGTVHSVDLLNLDLKIINMLKKIVKSNKTPIFITDSIGSMGHEFPVKTILELCDIYQGYAYIDDAHGISITGKNGCGYALEQIGHFHPRLILAISLSKAFGTVAAAVAVKYKADLIAMKKFCSTYIYCGPLSYPVIQAGIMLAKIHLSNEIYVLQEKLKANLSLFDCITSHYGHIIVNSGSNLPIRCIMLYDEARTIDIVQKLRMQKILVTAALYPTVEKGGSLIRIALGANHTPAQIQKIGRQLLTCLDEHLI